MLAVVSDRDLGKEANVGGPALACRQQLMRR